MFNINYTSGFIRNGLVALIVILLSACLKSKETTVDTSNMMIVNACSDAQRGIFWTYNGYLAEDTTNTIKYGAARGYYQQLLQGTVIVAYNLNGPEDITSGGAPGGNGSYSLFVVGQQDSSFMLKDTYTTPASGKANIRFVQASKSLSSVDVTIGSNSYTNIPFSYNQSPAFNEYDANGVTDLTVTVRSSGSTLATTTIRPQSGASYTIFLAGDANLASPRNLRLFVYDHANSAN